LSGLKFILDTGTTHSVLDTKLADKLALPRQDGTVLNFDRHVKIGWSNVPELQIGSLRIRNLRMMVASLGESSEFADAIDGIIGLDMLRLCQSVRINFDEKLLTLRIGQASNEAELDKTQALVVHLNVQGRQLCLILDTGLRDIVLFKDRISNNAPHLKLSKRSRGAREGWLTGEFALLQGICIGSWESQSYAFVIQKAPQSLPVDVDGFLGVRALNSSLVELNFEASSLRLIGTETTTLALNGSKMLNDGKGLNGTKSLKEEETLQ
jgi:Aspartyl protease